MKSEAALFLSLVDLTSLNVDDTAEVITSLCTKAAEHPYHTAAVCVYPKWVKLAKDLLRDTKLTVATVVNFPEGNLQPAECAETIRQAVTDGVDEIDFVIPWEEYKRTHDLEKLGKYISEMVQLCAPCVTKVICETSMLSPDEVRAVATTAIAHGVNFLKTSTGKVQGGATVEAVKIFAEEIKASGRKVGVKPSGGIKTLEDCRALWTAVTEILGQSDYDTPKYFRFGASGVRAKLLDAIHGKETDSETTAGY